ncbi:ero1-like protein [Harmonia axyridis]|uniref:ero1-like protein n=1 Tax=Harmonia axyridis TaxID=115357 RepID=UPI001E279694|nr:ero1-like protein [Harmonia axyridis]
MLTLTSRQGALITLILLTSPCLAFFESEDCFCELKGSIEDCQCEVDTVDSFNNVKIYPRLRSLLVKDYFRYFRVNLRKKCPFWHDDSKCSMRYCSVQSCQEDEVPIGLKGEFKKKEAPISPTCGDGLSCDISSQTKTPKTQCNGPESLDYLNTSLSEKIVKDMELWTAYDNAQENFCILDDNDEDSEYVDLLLNPERYTGYKGKSAERVWRSIYTENCFQTYSWQKPSFFKLDQMCLEERVFYRAISGLHTSINVHLCANYLLSDPNKPSLIKPNGQWGMNLGEFERRFSPSTTGGQGPNWLKNLYFLYLLELRAIKKAAPLLDKWEFYTGNEREDWDTKMAIKDLMETIRKFPSHFDESTMFIGDANKKKLKIEFRDHFRNVSRIMDCVGCDKCKLWGKLQTQGLGTALKILFSTENGSVENLKLQRNEIVSLLNAFGRLSNSIYKLDDFREMVKQKDKSNSKRLKIEF